MLIWNWNYCPAIISASTVDCTLFYSALHTVLYSCSIVHYTLFYLSKVHYSGLHYIFSYTALHCIILIHCTTFCINTLYVLHCIILMHCTTLHYSITLVLNLSFQIDQNHDRNPILLNPGAQPCRREINSPFLTPSDVT